ncbi:hypothetical protein KL933_000501 [Ogataea haglerorum]|uniref:Uncharacterized protein n=1 Tax=Ogataea haglerorum TaxID=1937702 RepID=A0AAN6DA28_9ASCO|nr:hypothetical protein KL951_000262 [Ogataea haglerorum]KAG7722443.1 hypothetical protein KL913_000263 [Ogataea haglerorum]KAG7723453.1 hypothetical protein KL949_000503 [Ogataea haglerorum]KAG7730706.1 hypothetical protein KL933_000501 [Ogataea haglerorum]KAG7742885.1 hypothetical protein KL923_000500 [Ogataea haglerorum]
MSQKSVAILRVRDLPVTTFTRKRIMGLVVGITTRDKPTKPIVVHMTDFSRNPSVAQSEMNYASCDPPFFDDPEQADSIIDVAFYPESVTHLKRILGDTVSPKLFDNRSASFYPLYQHATVISLRLRSKLWSDQIDLIADPGFSDNCYSQIWPVSILEARNNPAAETIYDPNENNYALAREILRDWKTQCSAYSGSNPKVKQVMDELSESAASVTCSPPHTLHRHEAQEQYSDTGFLSDMESSDDEELPRKESKRGASAKKSSRVKDTPNVTFPVSQIPLADYTGAYFIHVQIMRLETRTADLIYKSFPDNKIMTKAIDVLVREVDSAATLRIRVEGYDLFRFAGITFTYPLLDMTAAEVETAKKLAALVHRPVRMLVRPYSLPLEAATVNTGRCYRWLFTEYP